MIPLGRILARRRKRARRPTLPTKAERLYVGAMRLYAKAFREAVWTEVVAHIPELAGVRQDGSPSTRRDGSTKGPFKGLSSVRLRLQREAERIPVDEVGAEVLTHARKQAQLVGITNTDLVLGSEVMQWRKENVDLITRMTEEQLADVLEVVDAYDGVRVEELAAELQSQFNFTAARAELIARDQTLKLNGDLNENAQRHAGVTHYRWSTSQDGNVRDDHSLLEGRVFSWDEPPITNQHEVDKGKPERRCHPGADYQCRCVAIAELDEFDDAPQRENTDGRSDGEWDESLHPRDESGRFSDGNGSPLPHSASLGSHDASGGASDLAGEFRGPKGKVYTLHLNGKTYEISDRTGRPDTYPWTHEEVRAVAGESAQDRLEDAITSHVLSRSGMVQHPEKGDHRVINGREHSFDKVIKQRDPTDRTRMLLSERLIGQDEENDVELTEHIPIGWVRREK